MTRETPEPGRQPRRERPFVANVATKAALVLAAGFGLILLFRGCVEPVLRQEAREIQQKHHAAPK